MYVLMFLCLGLFLALICFAFLTDMQTIRGNSRRLCPEFVDVKIKELFIQRGED